MKQFLAATVLLLLVACGGGAGPAGPPGGPPPLPMPAPVGALVLDAQWVAPLHITGTCGGPGLSSPFGCTAPADALWGVLPQPAGGGLGCVDPEPNGCFQPANGVLGYAVDPGGMALVSIGPVAGNYPISVEATVTMNTTDCNNITYVGPVIYDGEGAAGDPAGNYRSLYLSCPAEGDPPKAWLYGPTYAGPINSTPLALGVAHTLRIDYVPGVSYSYGVDGYLVLVETPGSISGDPFTYAQNPHLSLWFGASAGSIGHFVGYGTLPQP